MYGSEHLDSQLASQLDLLKQLIGTPSLSRQEADTTKLLAKELVRLGHNPTLYGHNVVATSPCATLDAPWLLLNSHHDTVKPVSSWQRDPYTPTLEGDTLYGLGSNDAGAALVCLLSAFHLLAQDAQRPYHLAFAASAEEEISGKGGMEMLRDHLPPIALAIVGEPTQMNLAVAEKGLMVVDATNQGKAGHAARQEGDNAIYHAVQDIAWLRDYRFENESPWLGPAKMTATQIEAGSQHNVVPDQCRWVIDVRSTEVDDNEAVLQLLQDHLHAEVKPRSLRLRPSGIDTAHPVVKRAQELGMQLYGSPTLSDQALMPWASVKVGPGDSARSHQADEYITIHELEQGLQGYLNLLTKLDIA